MSIAYLDAGSASIVASVLVGGVAGVGVAARSAKARLAQKLGRKQPVAPDEETTTEPEA